MSDDAPVCILCGGVATFRVLDGDVFYSYTVCALHLPLTIAILTNDSAVVTVERVR